MKDDFYMINRNKLLLMVKELHKRGFEKLRIIPSVAPSGLAWRCLFINGTKDYECVASNWICNYEYKSPQQEIDLTLQELADAFIIENQDFIKHCRGKNEDYVKWFSDLAESLKEDELPYAFDIESRFFPCDIWKTTGGKEIKTLPNEKKYYS